jgi:hypothetical protein
MRLYTSQSWEKLPNIINMDKERTIMEDPSDPDYPPAGNFSFDGSNDVFYGKMVIITGIGITPGDEWAVPCDAITWNGVERVYGCLLKRFGNYYLVRSFLADECHAYTEQGIIYTELDEKQGYSRLAVTPFNERLENKLEHVLDVSGVAKGFGTDKVNFGPIFKPLAR